jgi:hypothetical protein
MDNVTESINDLLPAHQKAQPGKHSFFPAMFTIAGIAGYSCGWYRQQIRDIILIMVKRRDVGAGIIKIETAHFTEN